MLNAYYKARHMHSDSTTTPGPRRTRPVPPMAQHQQRGFQLFSRPCLALAVVTMMCAAASTTAQQQPLPLPQSQPQPQPTATTPAVPTVAACPPAQTTLLPCMAYLIGNSSSPPTECCAQIRALFQSQAPCFCAVMASGPSSQLGSALGQLLPSSCELPANACSSGTTIAAPADDPTTPASGTTASAAAPATETNGVDPTAPGGGAGMKSVPGFHESAAAAGSSGVSAAALFMTLFIVYLL